MSLAESYSRDLHRNIRYFGTWLPQAPIKLGEIGYMEDAIFKRVGSLDTHKNIEFKISDGIARKDDSFSYISNGKITAGGSVSVKSEGIIANNLPAEGSFTINFSGEESILFQVKGASIYYIDNFLEVKEKIETLYKNGQWEYDWKVITEIVLVDSATILISDSSDALIELKASAGLGVQQLNLADASLGLEILRTEGLNTQLFSEKSLTPLYKISGLKRSWFLGETQFKERSIDPEAGEKDQFEEISFSELKQE